MSSPPKDEGKTIRATSMRRVARPKQKDPLIDQVIGGRYKVVKVLGKGGFGIVYHVEHVALEKKFALKLLYPHMVREQTFLQRFEREAKATCKIGHKNIIDITDYGNEPDLGYYFVMEYLEGETLHTRLQTKGPQQLNSALHIGIQLANALAATHTKGITHRDLKPENIFLISYGNTTDFVKILDFGIASMAIEAEGSPRLTHTGQIFGSPSYMSPEQALGMPLDHRTDIYSMGIVMYEMVTGDVPFKAPSFLAILDKQRNELPVPPRQLRPELNIDPSLEAVIMKLLSKNREDRYQSMTEVEQALVAIFQSLSMGGQYVGSPVDVSMQQMMMSYSSPSQMTALPNQTPPPMSVSSHSVPSISMAPKKGLSTGVIIAVAAVAALALVLVVYLFLLQAPAEEEEVAQKDNKAKVEEQSQEKQVTEEEKGTVEEKSEEKALEKIDDNKKETTEGSQDKIVAEKSAEQEKLIADAAKALTAFDISVSKVVTAEISFVSNPDGAAVFQGSKEICPKTPCQADIPTSPTPVEFRFSKAEYSDTVKQIIVSGSQIVQVQLNKEKGKVGTDGTDTKTIKKETKKRKKFTAL